MRRTGPLMVIVLALSPAACAVRYATHPGALNTADSVAYDALLVAQSTIDQARLEITAAGLPDKAKDSLNMLIRVYNVTRDSWLTYRGAIATNVASETYLDQLNQNLSDLADTIRKFKEEAK